MRSRLVISSVALVAGLVAASTATAALSPASSAAPSSTIGLYGSQDPTYDGVFRQGLAINGLAVNGIAPEPKAIAWLVAQQCADGSFQEYRSDLSKPCDPVDAAKAVGPDTNATALALLALMTLDDTEMLTSQPTSNAVVDAADKAGQWLARQQRPDGGFPYFPGSASDVNSTGIALNALAAQLPNTQVALYRKAKAYLARTAIPCSAGGGLPYQAGGKADALSTSQALAGLVMSFGTSQRQTIKGTPTCGSDVSRNAQAYLARALATTGLLPSSLGDGSDLNATATAAIDLARAGTGSTAVSKAVSALKAKAAEFTSGTSATSALGELLQLARVTGANPRSFGGVDLVSKLTSSMRRS